MTITTTRWSSDRAEDRFPVENPAIEGVITTVQGGGVPEIDAAVRAAHHLFVQDRRWRSPSERAELLVRSADVLAAHADELAELESLENGKPVADASSRPGMITCRPPWTISSSPVRSPPMALLRARALLAGLLNAAPPQRRLPITWRLHRAEELAVGNFLGDLASCDRR